MNLNSATDRREHVADCKNLFLHRATVRENSILPKSSDTVLRSASGTVLVLVDTVVHSDVQTCSNRVLDESNIH